MDTNTCDYMNATALPPSNWGESFGLSGQRAQTIDYQASVAGGCNPEASAMLAVTVNDGLQAHPMCQLAAVDRRDGKEHVVNDETKKRKPARSGNKDVSDGPVEFTSGATYYHFGPPAAPGKPMQLLNVGGVVEGQDKGAPVQKPQVRTPRIQEENRKYAEALFAIRGKQFRLNGLEVKLKQPYLRRISVSTTIEHLALRFDLTVRLAVTDKIVYVLEDDGSKTGIFEADVWCERLSGNLDRPTLKGHDKAALRFESIGPWHADVSVGIVGKWGYQMGFLGSMSSKCALNLGKILVHSLDYNFVWPDTEVDLGVLELKAIDAPEEGWLKLLGYRVGINGLSSSDRQRILSRAFVGLLPADMSESEQAEWGQPESCRRLKKCANCLASFARLLKRKDIKNNRYRGRSYSQAVLDWETDLAWLKQQYYHLCSARFDWPRTDI